jgi:O-acetyl-ADP-ribose deacetylase (regulator of RNase III)
VEVRLRIGDITTEDCDAIVNSANQTLLGGGGVDGAIHRAAGPALREACRSVGGCPVGSVRLTPGFELPAPWIIHTVGPIWQGGARGEPEHLRSCYQRSFNLAERYNFRSIAFPAISTGIFGYPLTDATRIALSVARDCDEPGSCIETATFICFDAAIAETYREIYLEVFGVEPAS